MFAAMSIPEMRSKGLRRCKRGLVLEIVGVSKWRLPSLGLEGVPWGPGFLGLCTARAIPCAGKWVSMGLSALHPVWANPEICFLAFGASVELTQKPMSLLDLRTHKRHLNV